MALREQPRDCFSLPHISELLLESCLHFLLLTNSTSTGKMNWSQYWDTWTSVPLFLLQWNTLPTIKSWLFPHSCFFVLTSSVTKNVRRDFSTSASGEGHSCICARTWQTPAARLLANCFHWAWWERMTQFILQRGKLPTRQSRTLVGPSDCVWH